MLQPPLSGHRRVLMTIDAVGGVWRYGIDLCRTLAARGTHFLVVGLGPEPSTDQWEEARALRCADFVWLDIPLDWQVDEPEALASLPKWLSELVHRWDIDLLHLNLPSQAVDLVVDCPIVVASHSCRATWWQAVRGGELPAQWEWNRSHTARGFQAAGLIVAPSRSHAAALRQAYGLSQSAIRVVPNGTRAGRRNYRKANLVLAAGRWWDDAKNGRIIDAAAEQVEWPVFMAGQLAGPDGRQCRLKHACPLGDRRPEEIMRLMGRTPIFVSASLFEPFGLAVLEAATAEAALVLSDIPTFRELWNDAALFVKPNDAAALAAAINRLVHDEDERLTLARAARRRSEQYSLEAQAACMLGVYDEATENRTKAPIPAGQCA